MRCAATSPSVFLPGPNTQPPCQGLNVAGAAPPGYPTYPAFGTGFTAGADRAGHLSRLADPADRARQLT